MNLLCRVSAILLCFTLLPFGTGCTATQVRDRAYLQALELENPKSPIVQIHDFTENSSIAEGSGETLSLAVSNAAVPIGKELFLGHLELIAYEDPAFGADLDFLMTEYRLSPSCKVLGLPKSATLKKTDTTELVEQLKQAEENGTLPETDLFTILRELDSSAGTALLPLITENGFSAAVITKTDSYGTLSQDAVAGLCWLRGDNFPKQIPLAPGKHYTVSSAAVRLAAEENNGHAVITVSVHLRGDGDFDAVAKQIQYQCKTAIRETVTICGADVFDWEACLRSQCYHYATEKSWDTILSDTTFQVQVLPMS